MTYPLNAQRLGHLFLEGDFLKMKKLTLVLFAAMLFVSACSEKPASEGGEVLVEEGQMMREESVDPITGAPMQGVDAMGYNNGVAAGTQQDLVANVGDRVFFGYDRSDIDAESRATLERQARWLQQYPNLTVTVEGHADERGTREYNLALGDRRATAVRNYLVALGVSPNRIRTISYGKERPAVLGSNPTAWAQNRRGVTVVE